VWIELHGSFDHLRTPLHLARMVHEQTEQADDRSVIRLSVTACSRPHERNSTLAEK